MEGFEPPDPAKKWAVALSTGATEPLIALYYRLYNRTHITSLEGWRSTTELHPHLRMVGAAGFEPATPGPKPGALCNTPEDTNNVISRAPARYNKRSMFAPAAPAPFTMILAVAKSF